jgi:hypothetical protein
VLLAEHVDDPGVTVGLLAKLTSETDRIQIYNQTYLTTVVYEPCRIPFHGGIDHCIIINSEHVAPYSSGLVYFLSPVSVY